MSFVQRPKAIAADDPNNWPRRGACGQCYKAMLLDPFYRCTNEEGKKNCDRCSESRTVCIVFPRGLHKDVRIVENLADDFAQWLTDNHQGDVANSPDDYDFNVPEGVWKFEQWQKDHNMKDSSSRVSLKPVKSNADWVSPLAGAPDEFVKFYKGMVKLIGNMTKFTNAYTTTSASESEQILHGLLKELVEEVRLVREVMMAIGGVASNETTGAIPGDVLQYFSAQ